MKSDIILISGTNDISMKGVNMVTASKERLVEPKSGWSMLVLGLVLLAIPLVVLLYAISTENGPFIAVSAVAMGIVWTAGFILLGGLYTLQPNQARVLVLFGDYKGTVRKGGFHWGNPFYSNGQAQSFAVAMADASAAEQGKAPQPSRKTAGRNKISLRARTLNGEKLKVNDRKGNPVEIATVVVWHVEDTAQAMFDVDDYESYVAIQSETALRHVASLYAYDHGYDDDADNESEVTLRGDIEAVSEALKIELAERLNRAGVTIDDARLTHLAYAPEIAQAMLRRQQAEAIIAARRKIVTGAVGMVEMALADLSEREVVELDDERRAAMVSNLMVVLCGESEVHPIVNAGSLY